MRTANPVVSNRERVSIPEQPASKLLQVSAALLPTGVTAPNPVTTTRHGSDIGAHYRGSPWAEVSLRGPSAGITRVLLSRRVLSRPQQCHDSVVQADRLDVWADAPDQARQNF